MENLDKKCSSSKHEEYAIMFCQSCKVYMCNKCTNFHSELFQNHITVNLNKEINYIFTGICPEENHKDELVYFCKTHNTLCCAACISKIKDKVNGKHNYCNVCSIEEIKNEKKNNLKKNINNLENLSIEFEQSINELKNIFEKLDNDRDTLKSEIQKIFTQIRNTLNEREEQLFNDIDQKFNEILFNNDKLKEYERLPNKIKTSLEKGKLMENDWNEKNNRLNSLINDCLNIEYNIKEINDINEKIAIFNLNQINIRFKPEKKDVNNYIYIFQNFGNIEVENKINLGKLLKAQDVQLLSKWIKSDNNEIKNVSFELCYDAKTNGDNKNDFHKFCDKVGPSLLIIKTEDNYIFGGYTKENWETIDNDYIFKNDDTAFLFSINNKQRLKVKNGQKAIVIDKNYGPIFGQGNAYEICFSFPFLSNTIQILDKGDYGDKELILTGKKSKKPVEIELYKVYFKNKE